MKIQVEFVDLSGRNRFSPVELEDTQLPPSFEVDTTMHFGDLRFQVKRAEPADFRKTGCLRVELWPIDSIELDQILCSIPSIAEALPEIRPPWGPGCLVLNEDDWRQIELVSAHRRDEVERELAGVRRIFAEERHGEGFRTLHVRKLEHPIEKLTVRELEAALPPRERFLGLTFRDAEGRVPDGFAWTTERGTVVYGEARDGQVVTACLEPQGNEPGLSGLADVLLVDWCAARVVNPDDLEGYEPGYRSIR